MIKVMKKVSLREYECVGYLTKEPPQEPWEKLTLEFRRNRKNLFYCKACTRSSSKSYKIKLLLRRMGNDTVSMGNSTIENLILAGMIPTGEGQHEGDVEKYNRGFEGRIAECNIQGDGDSSPGES